MSENEKFKMKFGITENKLTFTIGIQKFTFDYEPETKEDVAFYTNCFLGALARWDGDYEEA